MMDLNIFLQSGRHQSGRTGAMVSEHVGSKPKRNPHGSCGLGCGVMATDRKAWKCRCQTKFPRCCFKAYIQSGTALKPSRVSFAPHLEPLLATVRPTH